MKLFGIALRKATFNEITAAAVLGTGLWMVGLGFAHASGHALDIREAGALLLVTAWACIAVRIGLGIDQGRAISWSTSASSRVLLGAYDGALAFVATPLL